LKGVGLARHDELERLHSVARQLERDGRLALHHVARALRQEGHTLARHGRAVLGQREHEGLRVHALVVTDVPVALARGVQAAVAGWW